MNKEVINFSLEMTNAETLNPNISRYKCYICYPDEPANNYIFSKKVLENMIPSIVGSGVYTFFSERLNKFGGHEGNLITDKGRTDRTGELRAIGFVDTATKPFWEKRNINGKEREYLTCYVYLWSGIHPILKDLDKLKIYQSMEVETASDKKDGMLIVKKAVMQRLVLIGDNPAFDGSTFVKFQKESFNEDSLLLLKQEFNKTFFRKDIATIIKEREKGKEGGENMSVKNTNFTDEPTGEEDLDKDKLDKVQMQNDKQKPEEDDDDNKANGEEEEEDEEEEDEDESQFSNVEFSLPQEKWGTGSALKINKSKEALSDSSWGDVDKTSLRWKILKASNYKTLVRSVYLRIDSDWESSPSSGLSYPVMQVKGDEVVYNSGGLSSALAFARQHNETSVINKVLSIRKKMGIEETKNAIKESFVKAVKEGTAFSLNINKDYTEFIDTTERVCYQVKNNVITKFTANEETDFAVMPESAIEEEVVCVEDFMEYVSCKIAEMQKQQTNVEAEVGKKILEFKAQEEELQTKMANFQKEEQDKETKFSELQKELEEAKLIISEFQNKVVIKEMNEFISSKKEFEGVFTETEKVEFAQKCIEQSKEDTEKMILATFAKKVLDKGQSIGRASFTTMGIAQKKEDIINTNNQKDLYKLIKTDK